MMSPSYSPPLQATGYGGTVQEGKAVEDKIRRREQNPDEEVERAAAAREVTVYFNSDVAGGAGGGRGGVLARGEEKGEAGLMPPRPPGFNSGHGGHVHAAALAAAARGSPGNSRSPTTPCRRHAVALQAHPTVGQAAPRAVHPGILHRPQQKRQGHHGCARAARGSRRGLVPEALAEHCG